MTIFPALTSIAGEAPAVRRAVIPLGELARDPRLAPHLAAPRSTGSVPGVFPRANGDDLRLLSVNLHMGVPDGVRLDPANERIEALRDIARFIDGVDPDVVIVQELRNRPVGLLRPGVGDQASLLAHLMRADDMAFTPAITGNPTTTWHAEYGTGAYARNGYSIDSARNVLLPAGESGIERRSAGIGDIRSPDGRSQLVLGWTHLANRPVEDAATRDEQLDALATALGELGTRVGTTRQALGGDLNQLQGPSDAMLAGSGFRHAIDAFERGGGAGARAEAARAPTALAPEGHGHRIDHVYVRGAGVSDTAVLDIPRFELPEGSPTDHSAVLVDIPRRRD